jgi:copper chaperone CopZ
MQRWAPDVTNGGPVTELLLAVDGMTCDHCVRAVTAEVSAVPGVAGVDVDLAAGAVRVTGDGVSEDAVRDAIDEAGYAVRP